MNIILNPFLHGIFESVSSQFVDYNSLRFTIKDQVSINLNPQLKCSIMFNDLRLQHNNLLAILKTYSGYKLAPYSQGLRINQAVVADWQEWPFPSLGAPEAEFPQHQVARAPGNCDIQFCCRAKNTAPERLAFSSTGNCHVRNACSVWNFAKIVGKVIMVSAVLETDSNRCVVLYFVFAQFTISR